MRTVTINSRTYRGLVRFTFMYWAELQAWKTEAQVEKYCGWKGFARRMQREIQAVERALDLARSTSGVEFSS